MNKYDIMESFIYHAKRKIVSGKQYILAVLPSSGILKDNTNAVTLVDIETKEIIIECKVDISHNELVEFIQLIADSITNTVIVLERNSLGALIIDVLQTTEVKPLLYTLNGRYGIIGTARMYDDAVKEMKTLNKYQISSSRVLHELFQMEQEGDPTLRNHGYHSIKAYALALHAINNIDPQEKINRVIAEKLFGLVEGQDYGRWAKHDFIKLSTGEIDTHAYEMDNHNGPRCSRCQEGFCEHCDDNDMNGVCEISIPALNMTNIINKLREKHYVIGFEIDKDDFTCSIGIEDPENEDRVIYSVVSESDTMYGALLDATYKIINVK